MRRMSIILTLSPPPELVEALAKLNNEGGQQAFLEELARIRLTSTGYFAVVQNGISAEYNDIALLELAAKWGATTAQTVNSVDTHLCRTLMVETFAAMNEDEEAAQNGAASVIQH